MKKTLAKMFSALLALCMMVSLVPVVFADESVSEHWAAEALEAFAEAGYLKGDDSGDLMPSMEMTRAQFATVVNRIMGYDNPSSIISLYTDVAKNSWYYNDMAYALAAGYMNGTSTTTLSPESTITREQAFSIVARILSLGNGNIDVLSRFEDADDVSEWAKPAIAAMVESGYIEGYKNRLNPTAALTRAEGVTVLNNVLNALQAIDTETFSLDMDADDYTIRSISFINADGENVTVKYRAYADMAFVSKPVTLSSQTINIYVPEAYYNGESIGNFNAENAPIYFPNQGMGGQISVPKVPGMDRNGDPNDVLIALSKGFVVATAGMRGRMSKDKNGNGTGMHPASIVDSKSAVRFIRHNAEIIPGDTEKIIASGTSAGGSLTAALATTANVADYEPYLQELGAADERDDVYAVALFCPVITEDNGQSLSYEWQYNGLNDYVGMGNRKGTLTEEERALSDALKAAYPEFLNNLSLTDAYGKALTLDEDGNGSFKQFVISYLLDSAQRAIGTGRDMSGFDYLTIENGIASSIDFDKLNQENGRKKQPTALSDGSNYGNSLLSPYKYLDTAEKVTKYWRIRVGEVDTDASFANAIMIGRRMMAEGCSVDLAYQWNTPHTGDYGLEELFTWAESVCLSKNATANISDKNVIVDGTSANFKNAYDIDSELYIKAEDLASALNGTAKQFDVKNADGIIDLIPAKAFSGKIPEGVASAGGEASLSNIVVCRNGKEMRVAAYTVNGETYLRLLDIASVINVKVSVSANTVTILTNVGFDAAMDSFRT